MAKELKIKENEKNASFLKRIIAFIIDLIVINFVIFYPFKDLFLNAFPLINGLEMLQQSSSVVLPGYIYTVLFFIIVLALLYFALMEYFLRQTIGKMIMGIYIKGNLTFFRALVRHICIIPVFPFYILWFTEPIYLLIHGYRWLERITNTKTVEKQTNLTV